jgi:hypothetical protein
LLGVTGRSAEAVEPLRIVGKAFKAVAKGAVRVAKIAIKLVIKVGTFVWEGAVGTFEAVIGKTTTFLTNVAGMAIKLVMKATAATIRVTARVTGVFGTLVETVTVGIPA